MAFSIRPAAPRGLRLVVAGAVVLTALTAATAAAAPPTTVGEQADARPRSLTPGFLLDRGRYSTIEVPGATVETGAGGLNDRGQITGAYNNPDPAPSPPPATTPPMSWMG
jgi:hypothetical protein